MPGYIYLDGTVVDNGSPYYFGWDQFDLGSADAREPQVSSTAGGTYAVYPLPTAYGPRKGTIAVYAACTSELNKRQVESTIRGLLNGPRRLHFAGRWLDVYLSGAKEVSDDSRKAATLVGVQASFLAPQPIWTYNQPLRGLVTPVNAGTRYQLWDDGSLPAIVPPFAFTTASFTLTTWGTAFTWAAGTITGGPASTTVYLHNTTAGAPSARLAVALDGSGAGTFAATSEFYLAPGANTVTVENLAGAAITPGGSFVISFGDTYMRFL